MGFRRWFGAWAALVVGVAGGVFGIGHRDARAATATVPAPLVGPATAGEAAYVDGTYVWTDYVYDDDAAGYPSSFRNAADLVQLQITPAPGGLRIRALLETLSDPAVPVLGVGFDTDRNPQTGAPAMPGGAWPSGSPLGLENALVIADGGATLQQATPTGWQVTATLGATVDASTNTMETTVPQSSLDPGTAIWDAVGVLGIQVGGHSWADGGRHVDDLAFVGGEAPSGWQSARQNAILAGTATAAAARGEVDFAALAAHVTSTPGDMSPGFHTRLYRSDLDLGEGIGSAQIALPGGESAPLGNLYAGPYQPYLVWVGDPLPAAPPIVVYMHGFTQTHTSNATSFGSNGFTPGAVVVLPLGRGEDTFYFGAAEQDVLDATDDALRHYGGDADRVVLSGVSMGGFGTYRLGVRYPDRWSALVPFIGTGGSPQYEFGVVPPAVRNAIFSPTAFPTGNAELLENIANVPVRMINGQVDPIVDNALVTQDAVRLDELGYDFRSWVLLRRHHEVVPALSNCVIDDALTKVRVARPAHVVLSVEPEMNVRDETTGLDLRYDRAYWVSDVTVVSDREKGTVDAVTLARADRERTATRIFGVGQNVIEGADLCGPNPAVKTADVWRMNGIDAAPAPPAPVSNAARVILTGVSEATLDLDAMDLSTATLLTLETTADHEVVLHLRSGTSVVSVVIGSGSQTYTIG